MDEHVGATWQIWLNSSCLAALWAATTIIVAAF